MRRIESDSIFAWIFACGGTAGAFWCICGTITWGSFKLTYRKDSVGGLDGYTDSDWGNSLSRRSTTSLMARYNHGPVLWRSKMQKRVALSSAEAEYYSGSEMAIEIIYLRTFLANMQRPSDYTPVFEDNTVCIEWANHVIGGRARAKH